MSTEIKMNLIWRLMVLGILSSSGVMVACGPIVANTAIDEAFDGIEASRVSRASRLAPYEYTLASAYFDKAKLVEGHADYDGAVRFAGQALEYAVASIEAAKENKRKREILEERLRGKKTEGTP